MCTCPPNSLSARIGYGSQWIRTVTAPTTAVECFYDPSSFFGNVNPDPAVGAGNFICQCEASPPPARGHSTTPTASVFAPARFRKFSFASARRARRSFSRVVP